MDNPDLRDTTWIGCRFMSVFGILSVIIPDISLSLVSPHGPPIPECHVLPFIR
jgi:hypothetical protein